MKLGGGVILWSVITVIFFRWAAAQGVERSATTATSNGATPRAGHRLRVTRSEASISAPERRDRSAEDSHKRWKVDASYVTHEPGRDRGECDEAGGGGERGGSWR